MDAIRPDPTFKVWDLPVRLLHWLLVAAIAVAFLSAEDDSPLSALHVAAGWMAAVLVAFRLAWGLVGGEHARFTAFVRPAKALAHLRHLATGRAERSVGHNPAGGLAILLLIAGVAGVAATGWLALQGGEGDLHEAFAWGLLGLVGVHVGAVIATSVLSGENLARAMVTGRKRLADHPGACTARSAGPVALLFAVAVSGAVAVGIRALDPQAFTAHPREAATGQAGHGERDGGDGDQD